MVVYGSVDGRKVANGNGRIPIWEVFHRMVHSALFKILTWFNEAKGLTET